ncbi:MAG: hypothetical protein IH851_01085 [Armatimonadetes bacterium]|nr:hypothetical protein [Armatimonadota bacterium]
MLCSVFGGTRGGRELFYVVGGDGKRYGPADIPRLQEWARQGRIAKNTWLIREDTGDRLQAVQLEELRPYLAPLPVAPPVGPPGPAAAARAPGVRPVPGTSSKPAKRARPAKPVQPLISNHRGPIAGVVSLLVPGLGQILLGQTLKGAVILGAYALLVIQPLPIPGIFCIFDSLYGSLLIPVFALIDAYVIGTRLDGGEEVDEWDWFWRPHR